MTETSNQTNNPYQLTEKLLKRYQQLIKIDDNTKKFERIIALGKKLEEYPEEFKTENNQVKGCASLTYIYGELIDGKMKFQAWSNSHLVLGLMSLLVEGCNNNDPASIMKIDAQFIEGMGLAKTLTVSRANGFLNAFNMLQAITKQHV